MTLNFTIAGLALFAATFPLTAEFLVGFASADITPPVGWRRAGNYTELISTGVNDPLMTKAMVVQEGATTFCLWAKISVPCRATSPISRAPGQRRLRTRAVPSALRQLPPPGS